jgi:hypothetical protein
MIELSKEEMYILYPLCEGQLNVVLWSCVEGNMGSAWVDRKDEPSIAVVIVADFCFLLGCTEDMSDEVAIRELLDQFKRKIIIPYNNYGAFVIEKYFPNNHKKYSRYAIKKESDVFQRDKLNNFIEAVEPDFRIEKIDESNYNKVLEDEFMADCCSNYSSLEEFLKHGIGYVIIHDGVIISGASSYSYCNRNIDITIGTKEEYRGKGLALACASKLILDCLEKNIYPGWDASNLKSVSLAEKLGYHFEKEYEVYSIY